MKRLCHLPFVIALFWAADAHTATIDDVSQWCASNDAVGRGKCFAYIRALVDLADLHVEMKAGDQSAKSCFPEEGVSDDKVEDVVKDFFDKALKIHPDLKDFSAAFAIYFALGQAFVCEPEQ
jgi:Ssp1 endopeptidase immunity protein Rap1a